VAEEEVAVEVEAVVAEVVVELHIRIPPS